MSRAVLVCAAHPDDEVLGCGATIASHVSAGDQVHVAILSQGIFSRGSHATSELGALREAARAANAVLGTTNVRFFDFPDNKMDTVDRLSVAKTIEALIDEVRPSTVYTHDAGDLNIDHVRVSEAVAIACRPTPGQPVRDLLFFEVPSSTGWRPGYTFAANYFVDATNTLQQKLDALALYESEMRDWPHARSLKAVEHLARWRGSLVGLEAAEAFAVGRCIRSNGKGH